MARDGYCLFCEGVSEGNRLRLSFAEPHNKQAYAKQYCDGRWKECLIAQMHERKWAQFFEDEDED